MTIRRTLLATLAAAALMAPTAQAEQAPDMHVSTAQAAAKAQGQTQPKQDLRSPDARDAGQARPKQDLRSPDARDAAQAPPAQPGDPAPLPAPAQQPVTDDGSLVPVLPVVAGLLVVLAAGLMARYGARRVNRRARIAA